MKKTQKWWRKMTFGFAFPRDAQSQGAPGAVAHLVEGCVAALRP
eukprot:CAMPEP_0198237778 /NCGR_PEP_ID=MMETSP1446-20131203/3573_1 /TAXON_ID=1461542 ORGANISM="Unidentified sp, Strain CCMP2111" /NCGR_SAMPLE_ID=MMETSP1446 /ASSEMBLY_ACC=CAM_ASM_001112 /LENGTH=43 /DNA_ID= /DNA_START= /DNA_END= /DNA_ORIENTATION=